MTPIRSPTASHRTSPGPPSRQDGLAKGLLKSRVLLTSYAPLALILFFRVEPLIPRLICLGLALVGLGDALRLVLLSDEKRAVPREFVEVRDSGSQVAAYLATYLLPLLAVPNPSEGDLIGYAIYAAIVVVITLRSDLAHINPTLYLLGWKVVTVVLADGRERYLICRKTPRAGAPIRVTELYGVLHEAEQQKNDARSTRVERT